MSLLSLVYVCIYMQYMCIYIMDINLSVLSILILFMLHCVGGVAKIYCHIIPCVNIHVSLSIQLYVLASM